VEISKNQTPNAAIFTAIKIGIEAITFALSHWFMLISLLII